MTLESDIADAKQHIQDFDDIEYEWNVSKPQMLLLSEIKTYDDIVGWVQWHKNELVGKSAGEVLRALTGFRGPQWASMASEWVSSGEFPPIIIGETPGYQGIADGRGRFSLAWAIGVEKLPVVFLSGKKMKTKVLMKRIKATKWYACPSCGGGIEKGWHCWKVGNKVYCLPGCALDDAKTRKNPKKPSEKWTMHTFKPKCECENVECWHNGNCSVEDFPHAETIYGTRLCERCTEHMAPKFIKKIYAPVRQNPDTAKPHRGLKCEVCEGGAAFEAMPDSSLRCRACSTHYHPYARCGECLSRRVKETETSYDCKNSTCKARYPKGKK